MRGAGLLGFGVQDSGCGVKGAGFRVFGVFGVWKLEKIGSRVQGLGIRFEGLGFRVWG